MDARLVGLLSASQRSDAGVGPLPERLRRTALVLAGLGCGASPAFFGYFDMSVWGPIAIGLIALSIGLLVARPALPTGLAVVAVLGVLAFAAWSLLSMGWAESADRALTEGDRWLLYGVFLLALVLLISDRPDGEVFVLSFTIAVLCVAAYEVIRMLGGEGPSLFGGSRLLEPLGYTNGLGGYFLLGFWPVVAVAERSRWPALAGLAAGAATMLASLVLLTDSRGTAFAFAASAVVLLALVRGRNRRAWILLAVLGGLAVAWGPLTDVIQVLPPRHFAPPAATIERGAEWGLAVSAIVGVAWGFASWAVAALRVRRATVAEGLRRASAVILVGIVVVGLAGAALAVSHPVRKISDQYKAFTSLEKVQTGVRFTSGGGNRYDYWRIAWNQFTDHPLDGVGAGNFDRTYFLERQTDEDVRQAHSIELQTLGETGLVGALALAAFLVAVLLGLWRRARSARRDGSGAEVGLTVAAGGMFIVWLAQTSVDWLHLIPGLTGAALGGAAILLIPAEAGARARLRTLPLAGVAAAIVLAAVAIFFIGRPTLAERLRSEARAQIASEPKRALGTAEESLSLNPDSVQGYYLKAAGLARLGSYPLAKAALGEAISREPHNYVSWVLLGDLATRRGDISAAMRAYRRGSSLNPRDRELSLLGTRRALVIRLHRDPESVVSLPETGG
jgi:O-Antigen ligase